MINIARVLGQDVAERHLHLKDTRAGIGLAAPSVSDQEPRPTIKIKDDPAIFHHIVIPIIVHDHQHTTLVVTL